MSYESKRGLITFYLSGEEVTAPIGWQDINILASFDEGNVQANISTDKFTVFGDTARKIIEYIEAGESGGLGIFEGIALKISISNNLGSYVAFDGYADLTDEFESTFDSEFPQSGKVSFSIKKAGGINQLADMIEGLTYGYLESIGVFSASDYTEVDYLVEKQDNALEIISTSITLFLMVKELAESSRATAEAIVDAASILTGGGTTGGLGAAVKAVGQALILVAYNAALIVAVLKLSDDLFAAFISPNRKHKCIQLNKLIGNVIRHLGYMFATDIEDLDSLYYLPSNPNTDKFGSSGFVLKGTGTSSGIPNRADFGYVVKDMFDKLREMFDARFAIINNTVHFRSRYSDFWKNTSSYQMPQVQAKAMGYNTNDLNANVVITMSTDFTDIWTLEDYSGTGYEVVTKPASVLNNDAVYIKGLDDIRIPFAKGSRKSKLNPLEEALASLGGVIDSLTKVFGSGTKYKAKVKNRLGRLRVGANNHAVPKILPLTKTGKLPENTTDKFSAKKLYEDYHWGKSFVNNGGYAQRKIYKVPKLPFGFEDFKKVTDNNYFYDSQGRECRIEKLEWNINSDTAKAEYSAKEPYTRNLIHEYYEP